MRARPDENLVANSKPASSSSIAGSAFSCPILTRFSSFSCAIDRTRQYDRGPRQHPLEKRIATSTTAIELLACIQRGADLPIQQPFDRSQCRIDIFERQVLRHDQEIDIAGRCIRSLCDGTVNQRESYRSWQRIHRRPERFLQGYGLAHYAANLAEASAEQPVTDVPDPDSDAEGEEFVVIEIPNLGIIVPELGMSVS